MWGPFSYSAARTHDSLVTSKFGQMVVGYFCTHLVHLFLLTDSMAESKPRIELNELYTATLKRSIEMLCSATVVDRV